MSLGPGICGVYGWNHCLRYPRDTTSGLWLWIWASEAGRAVATDRRFGTIREKSHHSCSLATVATIHSSVVQLLVQAAELSAGSGDVSLLAQDHVLITPPSFPDIYPFQLPTLPINPMGQLLRSTSTALPNKEQEKKEKDIRKQHPPSQRPAPTPPNPTAVTT